MIDYEPISIFVERILPDYVVREYPNFVLFCKKYLEYLEQHQYKVIDSLGEYADSDTTQDAFFDYFRQKYFPHMPEKLFDDFSFFIKNARDIYRKKGTEDSYKFLLKALFGSDVEFYYPSEDVLRLSDNTWYQPTFIIPVEQTFLSTWVEHFIEGQTSKATGFVEKTSAASHDGQVVTALSLVSVDGQFQDGEKIQVIDSSDDFNEKTIEPTDGVRDGNFRWLDNSSFLSSTKYFQDNYYYQNFSYVIRSDISLKLYEDIVKELLHPAGMQMFGELPFLAIEEMDVPDTTVDPIWNIHWLTDVSAEAIVEKSIIDVFEDLNAFFVYSAVHEQTYKYFEDHREDYRYFLRTWNIEDLEHHRIGDFEDYPNELMHPITQVSTININ